MSRLTSGSSTSFYDSLILAAAIEARCGTLYSEDLQHGQKIEGVEIVNPLLALTKGTRAGTTKKIAKLKTLGAKPVFHFQTLVGLVVTGIARDQD